MTSIKNRRKIVNCDVCDKLTKDTLIVEDPETGEEKQLCERCWDLYIDLILANRKYYFICDVNFEKVLFELDRLEMWR